MEKFGLIINSKMYYLDHKILASNWTQIRFCQCVKIEIIRILLL